MKSKENKLEGWKSEQMKKKSRGGFGHKKKKVEKKLKQCMNVFCLYLL